MTMTYATVTGKLTMPGTTTGVPGRIEATPMVEGEFLAFPTENHSTIGPAVAQIAADGTLTPALQIPTDVPGGTLWRLEFYPKDKSPKTHLGDYEIPASTDLADLLEVQVTAITPTIADNIAAAVALGATNDTATASYVANPASATTAALADVTVVKRPDGAGMFGTPGFEGLIQSDTGNTAVGYYALNNGTADTTGAVAIGHAAGIALTTAQGPTLIGYAAGSLLTDAPEVTHVGSYAGWYASGAHNTSLGSRAMCGPNNNVPAMTGTHNTAIGVEALSTISTGSRNTAIGWEAAGGAGPYVPITNVTVAGTTVTVTMADTGAMVVGMPLLISDVVGFSANSPNGYGRVVTAILSGTQLTYTQNPAPTGTYTSGGTVLAGSVTGNDNVAVGYLSLFNNQRGHNNIAVGSNALINLDNASNNVAVGGAAMNLSTTAANNVAVGHQTAFGLTTGTENVFVGGEAGYTGDPTNKTTTGAGQTFIGYKSGQYTTAQGVRPVGIGAEARTGGHYGVAVGANSTANGHYAIAIGRGVTATGQGAVAIGVDSGGVAAQATAWNDFVLGTALHRYRMPGLPTTNPGAATGILWNDGGVIKVA